MAKKFVRGITGVKNINKQGLDTNNVNDLLSDGEHNYIHRKKKDKTEEYHNLTNNLKTIDSDNTALLSVTNYNNTKNSATLHPHHDAQKEQKLYSTDETIDIVHGDNGTGEFTNVDVDTKKVLTHDKLVSNSQYVTLSHAENSDTTEIKTDKLDSEISELKTKVNQSSGGVIYQRYIQSTQTIYATIELVCKPLNQLDFYDMEVNMTFRLPRHEQILNYTLNEHDGNLLYYALQTYGGGNHYNSDGGFMVRTNGCFLLIDYDQTTLKVIRDEYQYNSAFSLTFYCDSENLNLDEEN